MLFEFVDQTLQAPNEEDSALTKIFYALETFCEQLGQSDLFEGKIFRYYSDRTKVGAVHASTDGKTVPCSIFSPSPRKTTPTSDLSPLTSDLIVECYSREGAGSQCNWSSR